MSRFSNIPLHRDDRERVAGAVAAFAAGEARLDVGKARLAGELTARAPVGASCDEGGELLRPQPADMAAPAAARFYDVPFAQIG